MPFSKRKLSSGGSGSILLATVMAFVPQKSLAFIMEDPFSSNVASHRTTSTILNKHASYKENYTSKVKYFSLSV